MRVNRKIGQIIAVAALFLVPVVVAWFLYAGAGGTGFGKDAHGVLADPPIILGDIELPAGGDAGTEARLTGRWSFLYAQRGDCAQPCEEALIRMRQVRLALGKDASRVQRVFVPLGHSTLSERHAQAFPGMATLPAETPGRNVLIERIGTRQPAEIVLIDPLGNLILSYPPGVDSDGLFRDIKHLLRISKIG